MNFCLTRTAPLTLPYSKVADLPLRSMQYWPLGMLSTKSFSPLPPPNRQIRLAPRNLSRYAARLFPSCSETAFLLSYLFPPLALFYWTSSLQKNFGKIKCILTILWLLVGHNKTCSIAVAFYPPSQNGPDIVSSNFLFFYYAFFSIIYIPPFSCTKANLL